MNQKPITSAMPAASPTAPVSSNPLTDDDELQRAIEDITKNSISDSSIFGEKKPASNSTEDPVKPFAPDAPNPAEPPFPEPLSGPALPPNPFEFTTTPIDEELSPNIEAAAIPSPVAPAPIPAPLDAKAPAPLAPKAPAPKLPTEKPADTASEKKPKPQTSTELDDIRKKALDALVPLLDKIDTSPEQKFQIYRGYIESGHREPSVVKSAYDTAENIKDDTARAEALFFIFSNLDK